MRTPILRVNKQARPTLLQSILAIDDCIVILETGGVDVCKMRMYMNGGDAYA